MEIQNATNVICTIQILGFIVLMLNPKTRFELGVVIVGSVAAIINGFINTSVIFTAAGVVGVVALVLVTIQWPHKEKAKKRQTIADTIFLKGTIMAKITRRIRKK